MLRGPNVTFVPRMRVWTRALRALDRACVARALPPLPDDSRGEGRTARLGVVEGQGGRKFSPFWGVVLSLPPAHPHRVLRSQQGDESAPSTASIFRPDRKTLLASFVSPLVSLVVNMHVNKRPHSLTHHPFLDTWRVL